MNNNNYRSSGHNNRNNQNLGNQKDCSDKQRGPRNLRNRNSKFHNQEREKKEAGVSIQYKKGKISREKVKYSFIVYRDTHEIKVNTHEYIGSGDEELLTVVKEILKIIHEYELLPVEVNSLKEEMALGQER